MAVDLPAPGLAWRRRAEDADPIEPFAVLLRLAGDLEGVLVEPHDVAGGFISRGAHAFAQQGERGLALIMAEIGQADPMAHQPGMNVRPLPPRLVTDREASDLALFRAKRSNEQPRRFQQRRERYASILDHKEPRHDPVAGRRCKKTAARSVSGVGIEYNAELHSQYKPGNCQGSGRK